MKFLGMSVFATVSTLSASITRMVHTLTWRCGGEILQKNRAERVRLVRMQSVLLFRFQPVPLDNCQTCEGDLLPEAN